MVRNVPAPLTRIGFRRDVRLFLMALVGFLGVVIVILLLLLRTVTNVTEGVVTNQWNRMADAADETLRTLPEETSRDDIDAHFISLITQYGFVAVELAGKGPTVVTGIPPVAGNGVAVRRTNHLGTVTYWFDASQIRAMNRTIKISAIICILAAAAGMILLLLYLPKILRPIEEMMDHAREIDDGEVGGDESRYLIETFKSSIARLKQQEIELTRLHESEKMRADELQLVTATLTRSLTSGFIALDPEGHVIDINAAARSILGLNDADGTQRETIELLLGKSPFAEALASAFGDRQTLSRQEISLIVAGADVRVGLATVPLFGADEQFLGMLALFTDLTPIRELEARVRDLQTLADLGEVSGGIAHEFRNSLSTILGYLKLARRAASPAETVEKLTKAETEASLLASAVERLLTFARPMSIQTERVDLLRLSREIADRVRDGAPENIRFIVEGSQVEIEGDRALLNRAIENVIRNAAESVAQKNCPGTVSVSVEEATTPSLTITDDGVGLDSAAVSRLFLPFQSDKPNGFGLGLPLARKIILLHGGTMKMRGEPGVGATVTIHFPAAGSVLPWSEAETVR